MNTPVGTGLHPALRAFPGAVLELAPDGTVRESNGVLERGLEREIVGRPLGDLVDEPSRAALAERFRHPGGDGEAWALVLQGRDASHAYAFHATWSDDPGGGPLWLVEIPRDVRATAELAEAGREQAVTLRQLERERARLGRTLDELERELSENASLGRTLQQQNEEMEKQNEELLSMTEELHAGEDRLLHLNHQLERRSRELQLAVSARNRFYASMSHELRTPINAVMGYNDLLLASVYGPLSEQQELAIERSQRAAQHLRELVNDVLDLSRLESGRVRITPETVELAPLVEEVFATMRPMAQASRVELRMQAGAPVRVVTDRARLRQVLESLVSNAIRFGAGAPVWVRVEPARGGARVEVVDGGPGIPREDLGRIFDEFVQLARDENGDSAGVEGTGLGLPIAQRVARLLEGTIEVSSTPGVGSTFSLTLPDQVAEKA